MATDETSRYSDEPKPLAAYALIAAVFNAGFGVALARAARAGSLPDRVGLGDVVLLGVATHKAARLISKDTVTSFVRAPFTRYEGPGEANELEESPRGDGLRRAVGELLVCPPCVGLWVAAGLVTGLVRAPRPTRTVAATLAAFTLADFLHQAHVAAHKRS
jgi:hypothetical protein